MRATLFVLALASAGCVLTPANSQVIDAQGDYDGDRRSDTAAFEEDAAGNLVLVVRRAATPGENIVIWTGDVSSRPYFAVSTAHPGAYQAMCHLYDSCAPESVSLSHDGLIVHALEGPAEFLYYWDGASFRNIIISE